MHFEMGSINHTGNESNDRNPHTIWSQSWWHGGTISDFPGEGMVHPTQPGGLTGVLTTKENDSQGECAEGVQVDKPSILSRADGRLREEALHSSNTAAMLSPKMVEYLALSSKPDLISHPPTACAPYSYSDPCFSVVPTYGPEALVHPQCPGIPHARMVLPLDMAEEPIYVNAKQYHGILRRRQSRAKAELENRVIKVRKPYLHKSRHLHAMRRARGCGGRFLNTKKLDSNTSNTKGDKSNASDSTMTYPIDILGNKPINSVSSAGHKVAKEASVHEMQAQQTCVNGRYQYHQSLAFSYTSFSDKRVESGDNSRKQQDRFLVNKASTGALTIK